LSPPGSAAGLLDFEEVARKSAFGPEVGTQVWLLDLQALGLSVVDQVGCLHGQGVRVELVPGVVVELVLVGSAGDGVDRYGDPRAEGTFDVVKADRGVRDDMVQPREVASSAVGIPRCPSTLVGCSMYGRPALSTCRW
jgi:hypothetical protein